MGRIMKTKKILPISFFIIAAVAALFLFFNANNSRSNTETSFFIVYSDMLNKSGSILGIDSKGNTTVKHSLKIQDISQSAFYNNIFLAGGGRSNNNLFIDQEGNYTEFYLLDNPNYSGVTSITFNEEYIIAVMNGNVADNTYKNLLVIQDKDGTVIKKQELNIFASNVLLENEKLYIVGGYLDVLKDQWSSKIICYDMLTSDLTENIISADRQYNSIIKYENKLYCTVSDMMGNIFEIDILDMNSLKKLDGIVFSHHISDINYVNNNFFIVMDNIIYSMDIMTGTLTEIAALPQNTYVADSLTANKHIYYLSRHDIKHKNGKMVELGYIVDLNTLDSSIRKTPLQTTEKKHDCIVFFPIL